MRLMHEKVKELTDRKKKNMRIGTGCILSKDGDLILEKNAVKERWVQYIHDLYNDENRGIRPDYGGDCGPSITRDEISEAIKKMQEDKINAFEMCIFRRMFRIPHLHRKTNVKVLEMAKAKQTLLRAIQETKLHYFGYLIRGKGKQKLLMEAKVEGSRRREKQRKTWTIDVTDWFFGLSYRKCVRRTENRKEWNSMAADLAIQRWHPQ